MFFLSGCKDGLKMQYSYIEGETWGTYYRIVLESESKKLHHEVIKQILKTFDEVLSTYVPNSCISKFNKNKEGIQLTFVQDKYFYPVYEKSKALHKSTDGYLDVTVMPLLNYWGFGYESLREHQEKVDSSRVELLRSLVDINKISRIESAKGVNYSKADPEMEIDFSALAKGYGIDIIAQYLDEVGVKNYLIDIGGEARSKGVNPKGEIWKLAINKPYPEAKFTTQELIILLEDKSIATSGNYREMYEIQGKVYGHIINPRTGYPYPSDVLSASVIAPDCMIADGLATACVAAGREGAKEIILKHPNVSACLIYDADGDDQLEKEYIAGFDSYVLKEN